MKREVSFRARKSLMARGEDGKLSTNSQTVAVKIGTPAQEPIKSKGTKNTNKKRKKNGNKRKSKK